MLGNPIVDDTGWSRSFVYFGFTVAVLAMGAISAWAGRAIDRYGARAIMTAGTLMVSAGLYSLSLVESEGAYLAAWVFLGLGMRCSLYDAAFAALVQIVPSRGRLAISYLTLWGAFASSIFWVLGHYFNETWGWRQTLVLFSAINLAVCLRTQLMVPPEPDAERPARETWRLPPTARRRGASAGRAGALRAGDVPERSCSA